MILLGSADAPSTPQLLAFPSGHAEQLRREHIPRCHPLQEFSDELLKTGNVVLRVLRAPDISRVD